MSWKQNIQDKWHAFRSWQIGDCVEAAGKGDKQLGKAFFRGTIDSALPFFSGETINTLRHLIFRPGYMTREFLRGKDNHILSPLTALIVFFAMQILLSSMLFVSGPKVDDDVYQTVLDKIAESESNPLDDEDERNSLLIVQELYRIYRITHLDQFPEDVHNHSQQFLAGLEGWLRGQGVFTFIWQILLVTCSLWLVGRRYRLTFSASACIAAYMLCQYCFYNTLLMLFTLGRYTTIPSWLVLVLLYMNIYQLIGAGHKRTIGYVSLLTIVMLSLLFVFLFIFIFAILAYAYGHTA